MKSPLLLCISFIVVLTAPLLHAAEAAEPSGHGTARQEILILNSYYPGYAWSDNEQASIVDVFRGKDKNWLPVIEYLDLKRLPDGRLLAEIKKLFRLKYQNQKFSAVIAIDNPALEFAIDNQAGLFENAPIVFCGINNYTPSLLKGRSDVTGIMEAIDIAGTIEVMLRLHPAAHEIFVLHDHTVSGLAIRKEIEALVPRFSAKVRFRFIDPLTMEELLKELERLPRDSLILEIGFITDKSGRTFGVTETTKLFSEHSPVPIYSTYKQRLGFGIVGGKLLSARHHGAHAARIALRVLAGEKASAIPVAFESDSPFMFDYKVMSRFGIPLSALPEGSTVINKPASFYVANRVIIQTALGIIGFLLIVISLLITNIIQRRRSAIALRASEAKYYDLHENAPDMYFSVDIKTATIIECNNTLVHMIGYAKEELLGRSILEMYHPDCKEDVKILIQQFQATGEVRDVELKIMCKNGSIIDVSLNASAVRDKDGKIINSRSIWHDITERKRAEEKIKASGEQLRALAGRLQAVREEERTRIAREIHDELGGALTGLKIDFSLLTRAALKIENETVRTSLLAGMEPMIKVIDATTNTVRRIAMELRPGILDDLGLVAALEWQLKDFEKRNCIRCEFFPPVEDISLDDDLSTALFRIFQEALTNVARHSGATEVRISLREDADSSVLEVEDNGKGIEKEKTMSKKSLGILGMRERALMFGGRFTVTGTSGRGTKVTVEISPVEKRKIDRDQEGVTG
ncbi:MAG TPA: PAS domain-containing sensor histidine kinase [Syntrophales bacterium]|nr:PAS domain-containing sensor histidine kinase [Syntrophales bacterium]